MSPLTQLSITSERRAEGAGDGAGRQEAPEVACAGAWPVVPPGTVIAPSSPSSPECRSSHEGCVAAGVPPVPVVAVVLAGPGRLYATTPAVASEAAPTVTVTQRIRLLLRSRSLTGEARSGCRFMGCHPLPRAGRRPRADRLPGADRCRRASRRPCARGQPRPPAGPAGGARRARPAPRGRG